MEISNNWKMAGAALAGAVAMLALLGFSGKVRAEGVARAAERALAASEPWTGPAIGIGLGWNVGVVNTGAPIGIESEGGSLLASFGYDKQFGRIVVGGEVGYGRYFGDLETLGVKADMYGAARIGVLMTGSALLYAHGGYGRLDVDGGDANSWRFGPGVEVKIADSPFSLDMRYGYHIVDADVPPGIDVRGHEFTARLKFKPFWK